MAVAAEMRGGIILRLIAQPPAPAMPRPLFTANRQSANTLIWRRYDPFRPYRLLLWLIAAPPAPSPACSLPNDTPTR